MKRSVVKAKGMKSVKTGTKTEKVAQPKTNLASKTVASKAKKTLTQTKLKQTPKHEPTPPKATTPIPQKPVAQAPYEAIKKILLQQKKTLLAEAGVLLENTLNPTADVFPDSTDQASAETDQNFILRLREREQHLLTKIDDALERIDTETFGLCEVCGETISEKRLMARPVTTLCIGCKTKQEMEEKLRQE